MKLKSRLVFAALLAAMLSCACIPTVDPKPPPGPVEPVDPVKVESNCANSCAHLRGEDGSGLDCELGKPTPKGTTCETLCETLEANGVQWIACTLPAVSCADAEDCE